MLARNHRDFLRPLVQTLLNEYSREFTRSGRSGPGERLHLARALAERAGRFSDDPFPLRQVSVYGSWAFSQHEVKARAGTCAAEARTALKQGRYADAASQAEAACHLYRDLGDEAGQGEMLHILGRTERQLGNCKAAIEHHERALRLAEESRDRLGRGRALIDLGDVHERQKNRKKAAGLYEEALATLKIPEEWQEAGRGLRQLGDVYVATGDFGRGYQAYSQALLHAEAAHDAAFVAEYNDYLGYFHRRLGDPDKAVALHRRALQKAGQIRTWGIRIPARARALNHLGLCTLELAQRAAGGRDPAGARALYHEAARYEEQALALAKRTADPWRQGYVLRALALIHQELGRIAGGEAAAHEYHLSLQWAEEALRLARSMKEKEWEGLALHRKAEAEALLGLKKDGFDSLHEALAVWQAIGDFQSMGHALTFMGRNFHEPEGRLAEARCAYEQARGHFAKILDTEAEAGTFFDCARLSAREGRKTEAAALYEDAFGRLEKVRGRAGLLAFKKSYMERVYDRYEEGARYMLETGFNDRAFTHVEAMKARVFLDQLAEAGVDLERGIDPEMKKKRDDLEVALSAAHAEIIDAYKMRPSDEGRIDSLKAAYERLSLEMETLTRHIRLKNPVYASVQYPEPVTVTVLQETILTPGEILLEYFISGSGVYAFAVTRGGYEVRKLAAGEKELEASVRALIGSTEKSLLKREAFDLAAARKLYDILIKPFEGLISGRTLIIVPDGVLARLPFELLTGREGDGTFFLIERHLVKYVQSASVLAVLRTRHRKEGPSERFMGFGDPVYDYERYSAGKPEREGGLQGGGRTLLAELARTRFARTGEKLGRLKGSGEEIRAIEAIFKQAHKEGRGLLRLRAREASAKDGDVKHYGYLHFSAHGIVDPRFQAIVLSQIPGEEDDGFLTLGEIMNSHYEAHLVVLSACRSGLGAVERGEGITGLTRAVMYAGSPAAVVSLWSVSDVGTKELMVRFYENMIRKGLPKEEALRRAKLGLLGTRFGHPFFWSAFVMYGE
ncbi:MAG: Photosystem I assembly protein Ycf3 [Syntrophaceae bacterium PtaU1.Bin231]|nr:MAG: Photosystem I assembly protein Ycf3 [Syntrophaceae bacterium PtaU1.Bin231]